MITEPGFYKLTDQQYFADPALDYTFLSKFARSGAHAFVGKVTPSMIFGSAFHWAVLEPKRYAKHVKTKKSGYPEIDGENILLKSNDRQTIKEMKYKLWSKKTARDILKNAYAKEQYGFFRLWIGDMAKVKIDIIAKDGLIVDLKKTQDASYEGFWWSVKRYKYHWQAALYLEAVSKITGIEHERFGFIACEDTPPYECAFYEIFEDWLELAWKQMQPLIDKYAICKQRDEWEGYPDEFVSLELKRGW
ncbi:MAG: PD-(D/E)XK nuclease-like domain-containing protein [Candidatus Aminicenantes bacterium]|nr:MAG: PD-(D/E)XK nuclease-like domain-containing protein [Candidatus Aminicenantes bacterium]